MMTEEGAHLGLAIAEDRDNPGVVVAVLAVTTTEMVIEIPLDADMCVNLAAAFQQAAEDLRGRTH